MYSKDDWMALCLVMRSRCWYINIQLGFIVIAQIMGLLSLGTPFHWDEAKHFADHVRSHGITQFLNTWDRLKGRFGDELLWGDEVLATAHVPDMTTYSRPYRSST
jgi:hypothetical protein